jgi:hypothetical protein
MAKKTYQKKKMANERIILELTGNNYNGVWLIRVINKNGVFATQ